MTRKSLQICICMFLLLVPGYAENPKQYLFVWVGDANAKASDFLAVLDVTSHSPDYGKIVASVPVGAVGTNPHHTEYSLSDSGFLFANGFQSGKSFIFDVRDPLRPKVVRAFDEVEGYMSPHSFVRLPNGHVLTSFHMRHGERGGGLVEFDNSGNVIRTVSAVDPRAPDVLIRPYSLTILPNLDRVVSTSSSMHFLDGFGTAIQVWRLSDLRLLHTVPLSPGPRGYGHEDPQEPRVLADGKTVLVQTRSCGLHRITDIDSDNPKAEPVYTFEGGLCGVPIVVGHYWIEAVPAIGGVVALDISDPAKPVEVSRLVIGEKQFTHWLAWDERGSRIILNSGGVDNMLFMLNFDRNSGQITMDKNFHHAGDMGPGLSLKDLNWPHGFQGSGLPHGAVFTE